MIPLPHPSRSACVRTLSHPLSSNVIQQVYANLCPTNSTSTPVAAPEGSIAATADYVLDFVAQVVDANQVGVMSWKRMASPGSGGTAAACDRQRLRLNLMLTIAVTILNLVCFPLGIMVDRWSPRWVGMAGSIIATLGSLLFAFSNSKTFDLFIPAYTLIGVGGVCIFMSLLHLVNIFPEYRGLITTLYTATEDASTGVFYFFRRLHSAGFSLRTLFISYCAIPIAHFGVVLLQPKRPVINEKTSEHREFYPISLQPLRKQALSPQFIAVLVWNGLMGVTTYFYLSTLSSQLIWLFGSQEAADRGTEIFSFLFMICPFVAVPLTGWIIDAFGTWPSLVFVAFQALLYGVLSLTRVWWMQYLAWGAFVVTRASFIGVSTHWVNQMFGENFSTLIGFVWTIGGVCNFSNQLWVYIALNHLHSNFLGINIVMTAIAVISTLGAAILVRSSLGKRGNELPLADHVISLSVSDESISSLSSESTMSDFSDTLSE